MTEWQPIETAPMDGTDILLRRGSRVTVGNWRKWETRLAEHHATTGVYLGESVQDSGEEWISWDGGFTETNPPTHWQPMPSADAE